MQAVFRRSHELRNLNPLADPMVYPIPSNQASNEDNEDDVDHEIDDRNVDVSVPGLYIRRLHFTLAFRR